MKRLTTTEEVVESSAAEAISATKRKANEFVACVLEALHLETAAQTDRLAQMYLRAKAHAEMSLFVEDADFTASKRNYDALHAALSMSTVITRANDPADIWWQMNVIRSRFDRPRREDR